MAAIDHACDEALPDAVELLEADHRGVLELFANYRSLVSHQAAPLRRRALAEQICMELTIHTRLEDEIFYPAVRDAIRDDGLMDEAEVEHASARDLIGQVLATKPQDELYDARVTVLGEYVEHHVRAERERMFPRARRTGIDLQRLGRQMEIRKAELQAVPEALREEALVSAMA
jgi:hypothetical protein